MTNDRSINQADTSQYVEGIEDVKQCWQNIMFTIPGTIPLQPEFGCDLFKYLDKPNTDSFGKVRNVIIAALERWEPRAKISKVTRTSDGEKTYINLTGTFTETDIAISASIPVSTASVTTIAAPASSQPGTVTTSTTHNRLHDITSPLDHGAVNAAVRGKILTTDAAGAIAFTDTVDGGSI